MNRFSDPRLKETIILGWLRPIHTKDILPMDDAGCQNDVRVELVCTAMWCENRSLEFRVEEEEDLKGSRRELDRLAIFLWCVPSVAKVATRLYFLNKMSAVRCVARKIKIGWWDLYICWHGSASTSINRGLDDRWSRRFLAMATTTPSLSVHALRRFIVTVMIIRLFADKLSLLARVSFQDF